MYNELLFKAADPIGPDELQVTEVVFQACLPGNEEKRGRERNKIHRIPTCWCVQAQLKVKVLL